MAGGFFNLCARGLLREETREINSYSFIFCVRSPVGRISFRISVFLPLSVCCLATWLLLLLCSSLLVARACFSCSDYFGDHLAGMPQSLLSSEILPDARAYYRFGRMPERTSTQNLITVWENGLLSYRHRQRTIIGRFPK